MAKHAMKCHLFFDGTEPLLEGTVLHLIADAQNESLPQEEREAARNKVVSSHVRLAVRTARNFSKVNKVFAVEELLSECFVALMKSVAFYKPDRGTKFTTYATRSMWLEMVAARRKVRASRTTTVPFGGDWDVPYEPDCPDFSEDMESEKAFVAGAMQAESRRNQEIIKKRFGLDGNGERTLEKLGREYGLTKEAIRQIVLRFTETTRRRIWSASH